MIDNLFVKKLNTNGIVPTKAYENDAGFDLYASKDVILSYGISTPIETNIAVQIPEGYFGLILDRSSMGLKGVKVMGGVIDSGYRGELIVCLIKLSIDNNPLKINQGDKIAQLTLVKMLPAKIEVVEELGNSHRSVKGFGSSGK